MSTPWCTLAAERVKGALPGSASATRPPTTVCVAMPSYSRLLRSSLVNRSSTFAGSRPGALSATAWAAMVSIGRSGYLEAARRILQTGARIRDGIARIHGLRGLGDPLWVIAFAGDEAAGAAPVDVYQVMEYMGSRGWSLNGLQRPAAAHIAVTLRHTLPGVADRFLADLADSVAQVRASPEVRTGMAPVYGMAGSLPDEAVRDLLGVYLDLLFEV